MTIGWFTTIRMIKNILILTLIAALAPTARSSVSASTASVLFIIPKTGMDVKLMELKTTRQNGKSEGYVENEGSQEENEDGSQEESDLS
jgi:hypothetical protein